MKVRPLKLEDLSTVAMIEKECFPRPWSEEALYQDYSQNPSSLFYVVESGDEVVGHVGVWNKNDHVHITTLAISPDHRRKGLGKALLKAVRARYKNRDLTLEVRQSNTVAQKFYRDAGFKVTGKRPDYYTNNGEDALVMSLHSDIREPVNDGHS